MTSTEGERRRRVPAMAPDDRRAALIAATVPLLREHGLDVTTKQIAQAAGVAEGTIFGVFPDKSSLVNAALLHILDPPRAHDEEIRGIDPSADLRTRLCRAADLLLTSFRENAPLFAAVRTMAFTTTDPQFRERMMAGRERTLAMLTALIEPDRDRVRIEPREAAGYLLMLIGATNHGALGGGDQFTAEEMVSMLLDGLLIRPTDDPGGAVRC